MELTILQQNINGCGCVIDSLIDSNADVVFLSEYKSALKNKRLEENYEICYPLNYNKNKDNKKSICILALNKKLGLSFEIKERKSIPLSLRYIAGTIKSGKAGDSIEFLGIYIPQTCIDSRASSYTIEDVQYYQDRVQYKAEMIFDVAEFVARQKNGKAILVGDFNTDVNDKNTRFSGVFSKVTEPFNNTITGDTWRNKQLDYAFVSKGLNATSNLLPKNDSDHRGIVTVIHP